MQKSQASSTRSGGIRISLLRRLLLALRNEYPVVFEASETEAQSTMASDKKRDATSSRPRPAAEPKPPTGSPAVKQKISRSVPLEEIPNAPSLFRGFRYLYNHPEFTRVGGGWMYRGKFYPDYITVGGACFCIFRTAVQFCQGEGIDVGAGFWPLPGSVPVDTVAGPGVEHTVDEFGPESLDYVFSSHCLEHIDDWRPELAKWYSKVKPGGHLFLYLPHPNCEIWLKGSPIIQETHRWVPTPEIVAEALLELGGEIVSRDDGPDVMFSFHMCLRKS